MCDYDNPKGYTFPSFGFGSSEKRIWHFAKTLSEIEGFEVIVTGPLWLPEYVPNARYFPKRLNKDSYNEFLEMYGKCDYLFAGHEYFDKSEWTDVFEECAEIMLSYQLHPYQYKKKYFNGKNKFLFCYSDQMVNEYKNQNPIKALLFHSGVEEEPYLSPDHKGYLLWIGRLDKDKAPHYAVRVAKKLKIPIYVLGKTVYQPEYFNSFKLEFESDFVKMKGVVFGKEKIKIMSEALCAIYTINKNYSEAGAGVLGEILSCGVPIAGMSWTGDDAVAEALSDDKLGVLVKTKNMNDEQVVDSLCDAVLKSTKLNRKEIYDIGSEKYDPHKLVKELFDIVESKRK